MYYIQKTMEISACHRLMLDYESKCTRRHGHNWIITVFCKARELNQNGMVCDFTEVKHKIKDVLDHGDLNEILPFNPTAENIARWCTEQIPQCYKATVKESEGNIATYEVD
ncbi:MAG: 6-carboxytetrahydropterin synthase [Prevotella sp.]|nr:6-carboxytetrahydropterin synthase [Prevotella sp.]